MEVFPAGPVFLFFMMYIVIASYTMVSLITGIISESLVTAKRTDEMLRIREIRAEQTEFREKLSKFLEGIDDKGSGLVTVKSVTLAIKEHPELITQLAALD